MLVHSMRVTNPFRLGVGVHIYFFKTSFFRHMHDVFDAARKFLCKKALRNSGNFEFAKKEAKTNAKSSANLTTQDHKQKKKSGIFNFYK